MSPLAIQFGLALSKQIPATISDNRLKKRFNKPVILRGKVIVQRNPLGRDPRTFTECSRELPAVLVAHGTDDTANRDRETVQQLLDLQAQGNPKTTSFDERTRAQQAKQEFNDLFQRTLESATDLINPT